LKWPTVDMVLTLRIDCIFFALVGDSTMMSMETAAFSAVKVFIRPFAETHSASVGSSVRGISMIQDIRR
jgi:hypothetical protein